MLLPGAIALLLGIGSAPALPASYVVDRWDAVGGLPNNAVTDVIQSRDGYLWIATWAGIVRFDGVRFTPIAEDLPNDHARVLLEDAEGAMWIGVSGTGLVRWRGRALETLTPANGLAGLDVRALAEDGQGRIWAGTESGVSVIEPGPVDDAVHSPAVRPSRVTTYRVQNGLPSNDVRALTRARDGQIWIATPGGVCKTSPEAVRCAVQSYEGTPSAVLEDSRGRLWIGTDAGLFSQGRPAAFAGHDATLLHEGEHGDIWVGLATEGLARIDAGGGEHHGVEDGLLSSGYVMGIHEDIEGSVWVAIDNEGLARLKPKRVATYSTADGLPANVIGSIVQDRDGQILVATQCGPVSVLAGTRFVARFAEYINDACARVLWPARDGSLWIGTRYDGLFHWSAGRMEHFGASNGLSDANVTALFEDRDGVMWIGTELGDVHTYAAGRLSRAFGKADGVATGFVSCFAQDRDGRVWIGSNANGLSVFEHGAFRTLRADESPPTANISALVVDSRGDLWIGSAASGLFRRHNGRYEPFGPAQGLGDRMVALVVEDRDANLWVATAHGIARLERTKIEAVAAGRAALLEPIVLDRSDGLLNPEGSGGGLDPSGLRDRDGRVWISTIEGIAVIDPATFHINSLVPRVAIEGTTLENRAVRPGDDGAVTVPAGTASIEMAYTAFSFLAPSKVRFKYRLEPLETKWHEAGGQRFANYARLPPGSYRFQVLASNNDGLWSPKPAVAALTVLPFWWERWQVRAAALALLLAATVVTVRFAVTRRARERLAELERERALDRERTRIARDLHDELGSSLSLIGLMAEGTDASVEARRAAETLDQLVWTVNATNDTAGSFAAYAIRLAEEHLHAAGLRYRFHIEPNLGDRPLRADVRRQVYLAFKEAIHNAVKHAHASEVHIAIQLDGEVLVVEITDDGRGIDSANGDPTGIGMSTMRERLKAVGGATSVTSPPSGGTLVVFRCPLSSTDGNPSHAHAIPRRPGGRGH